MPLSTFIKYLCLPLRTAPLLVIVIFSFLVTLALSGGLLTGIPVLVILGSWFFKYSFVLLDHVVDGKHDPPALAPEMVNPVEQRPLGMLIIIGGGYLATMRLEPWWGEWSLNALRIALLLVVPAMIAAMSVTGRFFAALNPVAVFGSIARIPFAYAQLLFTIATLWAAPIFLLHTFGLAPPLFFTLALGMYLWLAMCSCIGGITYEQRGELGYEPMHSPERAASKADAELQRERDQIIDTLFAQFRGGAFANAGASVRKMIEESPRPLDEFRWVYHRASQWPDQRMAEYLADLALPRLLEAHAYGEALDVVRERLRANKNFRPHSGAHLVHLAMLARDAGDRVTARTLLQDFSQRFPDNKAAGIAAKLSSDLQR